MDWIVGAWPARHIHIATLFAVQRGNAVPVR